MPTYKRLNAQEREARYRRERRHTMIALSAIVLVIFSLGVVFGLYVTSVFAAEPEPVQAVELTPTPTPTITVEEPAEIAAPTHIIDACPLSEELQTTMYEACQRRGIPFALALAVAEQESTFRLDVVSGTNDHGLMQINTCNFGWLRAKGIEPLDHKGNIEAGVLILSEAVHKYGDYHKALMAYNCGDGGARKLWDQGIYSSKYSREIMTKYENWKQLTGEN